MKLNINEILRQTIKIIKSFDHPITMDEMKIYGLTNFIHSIRAFPIQNETSTLFDFGKYDFDTKEVDTCGVIKVSYKLLLYIKTNGHIKFETMLSEEELFQKSTIENFYDLEPDINNNIKELISLLEHLWLV